MKKVLILGSSGLLGTALQKVFAKEFEILAWDKEQIDVTKRALVLQKITAAKPDFIINATAYNGVDQAEKDEASYQLAELINGQAVGFVAEAGKACGVPVVHYSTEYVFDGSATDGYKEDAVPSPLNRYGHTKAFGERLLFENNGHSYLIRLSRLFGAPGTAEGSKKSFVDLMIGAAEAGREIRLVDEEVSCPTYSGDLAIFTLNLIKSGKPFGIYHGANSGTSTWYSLAQEVYKIKKLDAKVVPIKSEEYVRPAKRPLFSELVNTKLPPQRHWKEALEEYLRQR